LAGQPLPTIYTGRYPLLVDQFAERGKFRGVTSDIYQFGFVGF
jgi:hypothetical protein